MNSDPRIDSYIAESAPFARPVLAHLRKLLHAGNPDVEETIKWGAPSFTYNGKLFASFAAFKAHAAFGFHHRGMEELLSAKIGKTGEAMGLLGRITSLDDLPSDAVLLGFVRTAKRLHDSGAPAQVRAKPRPALRTPADLAAALKQNKNAAANWTEFSPSARREYIEWITEAKRPETRAKRLLTTLEWVAEGKHRNWKYQSC